MISNLPSDTGRPHFMTLAMWFAWLLRADIRAGRRLLDEAAQRDFVVWWLLFGRDEYPAVWSYGTEQVGVAMQPKLVAEGVVLPSLVHRIWLSRVDLQQAYTLRDCEDAAVLLCWYRLNGPVEYPSAPALEGAAHDATERPSTRKPWCHGTGVPRMAVALWARTPLLQQIFDPSSAAARVALSTWYVRNGTHLLPAPRPSPAGKAPELCLGDVGPLSPRCPGVNLVGFARAEFGLGEDVRMTSRALAAAGVDHVIVDAGTPPGVRAADLSCADLLSDHLVHPVTIFCLSAFDTCVVFLERGPALFAAHVNIGYWPWELPIFPRPWVEATRLVTEIWAATRFQEAGYRATCSIPVRFMPPAVDVAATERVALRPARKFVFIYPFDPKSYLTRKNPLAAVRAFRRAFPRQDRGVSLILRINGQPPSSLGWSAVLRAISSDPRMRVISGTLDRSTALTLLASCDCLISPHRAEGFGRNIAEAIALGIPVIATAFSGPSDYLRGAERLGWRRRRVGPGEYPFGEGLWWADPNVADLAAKMAHERVGRPAPFLLRRRAISFLRNYGLKATGQRFREALTRLSHRTCFKAEE